MNLRHVELVPFELTDQEIDLIAFRTELIEALWLNNGLGVSAVQIGKNLSILAMRGKTKEDINSYGLTQLVEEYSDRYEYNGRRVSINTRCIR